MGQLARKEGKRLNRTELRANLRDRFFLANPHLDRSSLTVEVQDILALQALFVQTIYLNSPARDSMSFEEWKRQLFGIAMETAASAYMYNYLENFDSCTAEIARTLGEDCEMKN